ncbi:cytochrome P450 6k1-like [Battus philenor]|uniref:cytochrome P450 6k1-like n=1 Tax=Battus philenor TaxID=42288 RepID=UPI0035CFCE00
MFFTLLTSLTVLIVLWIFWKWNRTRSYWRERNVPHDPPHPVLGSLTFLLKQNPGIWMREVYNRFNTPYVGIWLFWRPALIINSPDIARRVLVKDAALFRDRYLAGGKNDPIGSLNLFTVKDPLWSSIRKSLTPVFTSAKLRNLQAHFSNKSKELVQRIKMDMKKHQRVNIRMVITDFTTDVVGNTSFGVKSDATLTGESPLRTITKEFMKFSYIRGFAWCSIFFFPDLVDIFGFKLFPQATTNYFRKIFQQIVSERGGYETVSDDYKDLFEALLKIKQESDRNNEELHEDLLVSQAATFLQAGFDTTGSALTFCIYELAHQLSIQEKVYDEIVELKKSIGDKDFDADTLRKATYLNCVIKESLRKYPPMGWLDRIAAKDYEIDENLTIPAGTPVYINANGMQTDPNYFPNPEKFDPERYLPENERNIKPFTYIPFGEGPRNCIGYRFAMQNMLNVLANIILNYKIYPHPNGPLPNDVKIEEKGIFLFPGETLYTEFIAREMNLQ